VTATVVTATAVVALTGCGGPTATCRSFAESLAVDEDGRPSPAEAAQWFADHEDAGIGRTPRSGWREDARDTTGAVLHSGSWRLHAVQVSDGTWFVDAGQAC
jgi:hypothetical protein